MAQRDSGHWGLRALIHYYSVDTSLTWHENQGPRPVFLAAFAEQLPVPTQTLECWVYLTRFLLVNLGVPVAPQGEAGGEPSDLEADSRVCLTLSWLTGVLHVVCRWTGFWEKFWRVL